MKSFRTWDLLRFIKIYVFHLPVAGNVIFSFSPCDLVRLPFGHDDDEEEEYEENEKDTKIF